MYFAVSIEFNTFFLCILIYTLNLFLSLFWCNDVIDGLFTDPSLSDSDQREVIIIERLHFSPIISSDSEDSIDSIDEQDIQVINLETNNDSDEEMVEYNRDLPGEHTVLLYFFYNDYLVSFFYKYVKKLF